MNQQSQHKTILQISRVTKAFSGNTVLDNVGLELRQGEVMALMGENGAGKSTLMKILAGVYDDWNGEIRIDDQSMRFRGPREAEQAGIGIIYQELNLVPNLSVAENIFLGRELAQPRTFSERTAELIGEEIKGLVKDAYHRAEDLLTRHRPTLDRLAQALLGQETLDSGEVDELVGPAVAEELGPQEAEEPQEKAGSDAPNPEPR